MTPRELAERCEAMEGAVQDVEVVYERYFEPPYTTDDIQGLITAIPVGANRIRWASAAPFEERCLLTDSATYMQREGNVWEQTEWRSYDGKTAKHLSLTGVPVSDERKATGTFTRSKRFFPDMSFLPEYYTILYFGRPPFDFPLSSVFRDKSKWLEVADEPVNVQGFDALCATLLGEGLFDKQGNTIPWFRVYLSIDHGYTPVRFEHLVTPSGNISSCREVLELERVATDIWYPKNARTIEYGEDGTSHTMVYKASTILVNQGLTDEYFDFEFPPRTRVIDEISNSEYDII